jgi:hypothetical protein
MASRKNSISLLLRDDSPSSPTSVAMAPLAMAPLRPSTCPPPGRGHISVPLSFGHEVPRGRQFDAERSQFISQSPATYKPGPELAMNRRRRRRTSASELSVLESEFRKCPKPSKWVREHIAQRVGMTEKTVQIWFQNKRQSLRKNQLRLESQRVLEVPSFAPPDRRFSIYNDPQPIIQRVASAPLPETYSPRMLRLAMSSDGKAELVVTKREPLQSTATNIHNRITSEPSTIFKREKFRPVHPTNLNKVSEMPTVSVNEAPQLRGLTSKTPRTATDNVREAECITNLLSLRSGIWS